MTPTAYTVAYQPELDGFTSFFSFNPEMMIGMNNYLYSFKNGQIWKHYINPLRNTFYGTYTASTVDICFNDSPMEVKMFKTFSYEGNYTRNKISSTFSTYLSDRIFTGSIGASDFAVKEGEAFSNIITLTSDFDVTLKEQGVGQLYDVPAPLAYTVNTPSPINAPAIGNSSSYADSLYHIEASTGTKYLIGVITNYVNLGSQSIFYTATENHTPSYGDLLVVSKNIYSESFGLRGTYMTTSMVIDTTDKMEIFSVSSSILKSYP